MLAKNADSNYIKYLNTNLAVDEIGSKIYDMGETKISLNFATIYSYTYAYDDPITDADESLDDN